MASCKKLSIVLYARLQPTVQDSRFYSKQFDELVYSGKLPCVVKSSEGNYLNFLTSSKSPNIFKVKQFHVEWGVNMWESILALLLNIQFGMWYESGYRIQISHSKHFLMGFYRSMFFSHSIQSHSPLWKWEEVKSPPQTWTSPYNCASHQFLITW